jgi:molybdopterin-guanine dinucleotide biosynthesis protein A
MSAKATTAGLILGGGRSSRMGGGDKTLLTLGGRPMLSRIIDRAAFQVGTLAISANGDPSRFVAFDLPVLPDTIRGFAGPLAGILAGLDWAGGLGGVGYVLSMAGDTPFFPPDLCQRLSAAVAALPGAVAVAATGGRQHPVFALWPIAVRDDLRSFLADGSTLGVGDFIRARPFVEVGFETIMIGGNPVDPFFNVNRPEDLVEANRIIGEIEV